MKFGDWEWNWSPRSRQFAFGFDYAAERNKGCPHNHGCYTPWFLWIYIGPATLTLHGKERS